MLYHTLVIFEAEATSPVFLNLNQFFLLFHKYSAFKYLHNHHSVTFLEKQEVDDIMMGLPYLPIKKKVIKLLLFSSCMSNAKRN